jgi:multidrug efflux pump subunit AcrB
MAILISAFLALTLVPALCARFLRARTRRHAQRMALFARLIAGYGRALHVVLDHSVAPCWWR